MEGGPGGDGFDAFPDEVVEAAAAGGGGGAAVCGGVRARG